jgi:hypothetical protein
MKLAGSGIEQNALRAQKILLFCACFLSTPEKPPTGILISHQASAIARQACARDGKTQRIGSQSGSTTGKRCNQVLHKREI